MLREVGFTHLLVNVMLLCLPSTSLASDVTFSDSSDAAPSDVNVE